MRVASTSGYDVTTSDYMTRADDQSTPTLRFRLAADSFYEWIAVGGGGGDMSRHQMGQSPVVRFWDRWIELNLTTIPNATSDDDYERMLAALNAEDLTESTTDATVSWVYLTKTVVQLLSSPLVGFVVHRYVSYSL